MKGQPYRICQLGPLSIYRIERLTTTWLYNRIKWVPVHNPQWMGTSSSRVDEYPSLQAATQALDQILAVDEETRLRANVLWTLVWQR